MGDLELSIDTIRGQSDLPAKEAVSLQTQKLNTERGWAPDRSLQVWQRGTLLSILRTEEIRRKLERTCFSKERKVPPKSSKRHSFESKSESSTPKPLPLDSPSKPRTKDEVFLHENRELLKQLKETKREEVKKRMVVRGKRETVAKTARMSRETEAEEQLFTHFSTLNEKMMKSTQSHRAFLQTRASSVINKRKAPRLFKTPEVETSRLEQYLSKAIVEEKRVLKVKETLSKSSEEIKKKRDERIKKVETNLKIVETRLETRIREVEERQEAVQEAVDVHMAEQARTYQLRQEVLREKEEQTSMLLDRLRREQNQRTSKLLFKLSDSLRRVDILKRQREITVERRRDDLRARMLAKEKHLVALEALSKSPTVWKARKMLKALGSSSNSP